MRKISAVAKLFISLVALAGLSTLVIGLVQWECKDLVRFFSFLAITALASRLKVSLPGVNGNMSVNLPFLLIAVVELSLGEAVVIAAVSTLVQCLPSGSRKMIPVQALFNTSTVVLAVGVGATVYVRASAMTSLAGTSLLILLSSAAYLVTNTLPVAAIVSLTEGQKVIRVWHEIFRLTFPYFGFSAAIAALAVTATHYAGWQTPLLVAPVMALTYHSYKRYFAKPAPVTQNFHAAAAAD